MKRKKSSNYKVKYKCCYNKYKIIFYFVIYITIKQ